MNDLVEVPSVTASRFRSRTGHPASMHAPWRGLVACVMVAGVGAGAARLAGDGYLLRNDAQFVLSAAGTYESVEMQAELLAVLDSARQVMRHTLPGSQPFVSGTGTMVRESTPERLRDAVQDTAANNPVPMLLSSLGADPAVLRRQRSLFSTEPALVWSSPDRQARLTAQPERGVLTALPFGDGFQVKVRFSDVNQCLHVMASSLMLHREGTQVTMNDGVTYSGFLSMQKASQACGAVAASPGKVTPTATFQVSRPPG